MNIVKNPFFWLFTILFMVNQILEKMGLFLPGISSYLDDLLCLPLGLSLILFVQRTFTPQKEHYRMPLWQIIFGWLVFSWWFEFHLPEISTKYTKDLWDIVAYAAGGGLFHLLINRLPERPMLDSSTAQS